MKKAKAVPTHNIAVRVNKFQEIKLKQDAKAAGYPTVSEYVRHKLGLM